MPGRDAAQPAPLGEQHAQLVADLEDAARLRRGRCRAPDRRRGSARARPASRRSPCPPPPRRAPARRRRRPGGSRPPDRARRAARRRRRASVGSRSAPPQHDRLEQARAAATAGAPAPGAAPRPAPPARSARRAWSPDRRRAPDAPPSSASGERAARERAALHGGHLGRGRRLDRRVVDVAGRRRRSGGRRRRGCSGGSSGRRDSTSLASLASCAGSVHWPLPQVIDTTTPRSRTRKTSPLISPDCARNEASPISSVACAPGSSLDAACCTGPRRRRARAARRAGRRRSSPACRAP